jgi:carboxyl-terminal processing protease
MNKTFKSILGAVVALILLCGTFSGGLVVGWLLPGRASNVILPALGQPNNQSAGTPSAANTNPNASTPQDLQKLFKPFWDSWTIVLSQYVDQPVDQEKLMQGAIRGMLASLGDEHTAYMSPDEYKQANLPMIGEYDGIGAWVDITGKFIKIIGPMPNSPAEKAGLQAGDSIIKVDGKDMTGVDGSLVLRQVMGKAGTKVTLTISRDGTADPFDVTLERAKITVPSVESKMLDGGVGYVHLYTFGEKSTDEMKSALKTIMAQKPKGIILDLRNNGGGYLNTAIEIVSQFVGKGVVMYEESADGTQKPFNAAPFGLATDIPIVVLVNGSTASASEITAGAIQDYGRGLLVGEKTYGKGSVQNWIPLDNNEGAIRVTIAHWLTPKQRQIDKKGLIPDVEVKLTADDVKNKLDPQLDKAVEIIKNGGKAP